MDDIADIIADDIYWPVASGYGIHLQHMLGNLA